MFAAALLVRSGYILAASLYIMSVPFMIGAIAGGICGFCKGHVKHGLALLAGGSLAIGLLMLSQLAMISSLLGIKLTADPQGQAEELMKMQTQMQEQLLRQLPPPPGPPVPFRPAAPQR